MSERPGDDDAHDGGGVGSDGRLDPTWRAVLAAAWVGAFLCYAAVWQASVQIGIATWWVGPRGDPSSIVVRLAPFVVALAIVLHLIYQRPHAIVLSAVGVAASFALAVPDMSRSTGLATTELAIAALLGVVTASAAVGRR
ncbi:hypothetical protein [Ilumatobacter sp.]|uniref:hypothetical protein n=1 Tax=Ilumatobacter sp. TaxID=1967498 RepID=UPI003B528BFC